MGVPHDAESFLIAAYRAARIKAALDPASPGAWMNFDLAGEDLADHIREKGAPAECHDEEVRYELDRNGEIQELPLDLRDHNLDRRYVRHVMPMPLI